MKSERDLEDDDEGEEGEEGEDGEDGEEEGEDTTPKPCWQNASEAAEAANTSTEKLRRGSAMLLPHPKQLAAGEPGHSSDIAPPAAPRLSRASSRTKGKRQRRSGGSPASSNKKSKKQKGAAPAHQVQLLCFAMRSIIVFEWLSSHGGHLV